MNPTLGRILTCLRKDRPAELARIATALLFRLEECTMKADTAAQQFQQMPQAEVAALPLPILEDLLRKLLDALPPERVATLIAPLLAPVVRQSPLAVAVVKALAVELSP